MDTIIPSLSDPTPAPRRNIFYPIAAFVLLAVMLGGTLWYANRNKQMGPAFDPARQFVPKGAASLDVSKALTSFNFPEPLPFFDKRNVVQSLSIDPNVPASTTSPSMSPAPQAQRITGTLPRTPPQRTSSTFLSYRILEQDKEAIQNAFIEYFKNMGWKMASTSQDKPLLFSSSARQIVSVTLLDMPVVQGTDKPAVVAALTVQ